MIKVLLTMVAGLILQSCGPHTAADIQYARDCSLDGCDRSYQDHLSDYIGKDGEDGRDSSSTHTVSTTVVIKEQPVQGPAGAPGADGSSCSVESVDDGAVIQCEDGSSSFIYDGQDGLDGSSPLVEVLDPCGAETAFDEVLLVYEISGELIYIAYFESGSKRFLTQLDYGVNYRTTDGTKCDFTIDEEAGLLEL